MVYLAALLLALQSRVFRNAQCPRRKCSFARQHPFPQSNPAYLHKRAWLKRLFFNRKKKYTQHSSFPCWRSSLSFPTHFFTIVSLSAFRNSSCEVSIFWGTSSKKSSAIATETSTNSTPRGMSTGIVRNSLFNSPTPDRCHRSEYSYESKKTHTSNDSASCSRDGGSSIERFWTGPKNSFHFLCSKSYSEQHIPFLNPKHLFTCKKPTGVRMQLLQNSIVFNFIVKSSSLFRPNIRQKIAF